MARALFTSLFAFQFLFSLAQQEPKNVYKDSLGNPISAEDFYKATRLGGACSKEMMIENGLAIYTYKLESKSMQAKHSSEGQPSDQKTSSTQLPDFRLKTLDGKEISTSSLSGKITVFNFWFTGCKPCVAEIPALNKVVDHYKNDPNIVFVAPSFDDSEKLIEFCEKHSFSYLILYSSNELNQKMNVFAYPTHIVVDANKTIKVRVNGSPKGEVDKFLINAIDRVYSRSKK